jgi:hypothetical protein
VNFGFIESIKMEKCNTMLSQRGQLLLIFKIQVSKIQSVKNK